MSDRAVLATAALLAGQPDSDRTGESTMMSLRRFSWRSSGGLLNSSIDATASGNRTVRFIQP